MTETLVNRLVSESSGKILTAEIYAKNDNAYVVKYFINGLSAGDRSFTDTTEKTVEEMANSWLNGVKTLYG